MKSIRLSLVAYFLILLSGALGAASWLMYQTASKTMQEKEISTAAFIEAKCAGDIKATREAFDQRLLVEADKLASLSKENSQHHEFYYPLGMLAIAPMPYAHLQIPLWVAEGTHPALVGRMTLETPLMWNPSPPPGSWLSEASSDKIVARMKLKGSDLPAGQNAGKEKTADRSHEYLQIERPLFHNTFRNAAKRDLMSLLRHSFMVKQYSESLNGLQLPLSDKERLTLEDHRFDELALTPTVTVRRVVKKSFAERPRSGRVLYRTPEGRFAGKVWCLQRDLKPGYDREDQPKGKGSGPKGPPGWASHYEFLPFVFVHYAEDTAPLNEKIKGIEDRRDQDLTKLTQDTVAGLRDLRRRLWSIGLSTFFGILVGSLLVIRLGLSPLDRLSNAVSKVTPRDFRLHVDPRKLPTELVPIAERLTMTLEQLRKAFVREKQAAADISHELRTPLASLLTTAEVGLKKPRSAEEYRDLLQDCKLSGEQMMQLVERLLALARLDANADILKPAPVDVGTLARQCADMVRPLAEARGLALKVQTDGALAIQADGSKLREVLTNLLHNAVQYNKPAGTIDLTVQRENGHVLLEVRDTGIGISPEAREHIFERFYRADPSRHSDTPHAGLGLAIVKSYVDLMGGHIDVESSQEGSTFRVEVPAVDAAVPSATTFTAARR